MRHVGVYAAVLAWRFATFVLIPVKAELNRLMISS